MTLILAFMFATVLVGMFGKADAPLRFKVPLVMGAALTTLYLVRPVFMT